MAETTWRCSQCGTVNEPGSRVCAGCGKWPSLFDLQEDVDEPDAFGPAPFEDGVGRPGPPIDAEVFDPEPFESEELESESASDDEPDRTRGVRRLSRVIVPVALLLYFLISLLSNR